MNVYTSEQKSFTLGVVAAVINGPRAFETTLVPFFQRGCGNKDLIEIEINSNEVTLELIVRYTDRY